MAISLNNSTLLIVDVQMAFVERDQRGSARSTPQAEENIARLLAVYRENSLNVVHAHHHSLEIDSAFRAELSGSKVQEFAKPLGQEKVYVKHANSAFIGTSLEADLRYARSDCLVICGATANHCVETTTRMAGNLGFNAFFVCDAVWAYDTEGPDGRLHRAEDILSMTMSNLNNEFATVLSTDDLLGQLSQ